MPSLLFFKNTITRFPILYYRQIDGQKEKEKEYERVGEIKNSEGGPG